MIGFIGLGTMGRPMAMNLARASSAGGILLHDISQPHLNNVVDQINTHAPHTRARPARLTEIAHQCDTVFLCLPDGNVVTSVVEVLGQRAGQLVIDFGTTHPAQARAVNQVLKGKGGSYLDCPVSGEAARAKDGTLTVMVGGAHEDFLKAQTLLDSVGDTVVHMGDVGSGNLCKALNNCAYNASVAVMAELLPLASKAGLDPCKFGDVVSVSSGASFGFNKFYKLALEDTLESPTYGYSLEEAWKDMVVVEEIQKEMDVKLRVIDATRDLYQETMHQGHGHLSKGAMVKVPEEEMQARLQRTNDDYADKEKSKTKN